MVDQWEPVLVDSVKTPLEVVLIKLFVPNVSDHIHALFFRNKSGDKLDST